MLKLLRTLSIMLISWAMILVVLPAVAAAASAAPAEGIAQSYGTSAAVRQGMIVGLQHGDASNVVPLSGADVADMLGVAISASDAPITLSGDASTAQVYVATSGQYDVLVSNQNGAIKVGDYISISALNGIGMKADATLPTVLGKAAGAFDGRSNVDSTVTLKTGGGGSQTVAIGSIPVAINVANNPNSGRGSGELPGFLQVASTTIADKPVAAPRVYLSLAVLLLTALIAGGLLFSGVRGSVVSIGRNPLARRYIIRGLLQVVLTSIIIFIIGLFAIYLLLRL